MSDLKKALSDAEALKKGLFLMGRDRKMALSNHITVDLIDSLEATAAELVKTLQQEVNK